MGVVINCQVKCKRVELVGAGEVEAELEITGFVVEGGTIKGKILVTSKSPMDDLTPQLGHDYNLTLEI